MLVTSLKGPEDLVDTSIKWIPRELVFANFTTAIQELSYWKALFKSVIGFGSVRNQYGCRCLMCLRLLTLPFSGQENPVCDYACYVYYSESN